VLSLRRFSLKNRIKMKILKNYQRSIYGVKYNLFTVIFNGKTKQYCYYANALCTKNVGDTMIYKSKSKSILLNKYTMPVIGILYTIYKYLIKYPFAAISLPFYMYFDGCRNFIRNTAWYNNVRYFNWANIVIIITLSLWLALSWAITSIYT
jgi:hypothetical protein